MSDNLIEVHSLLVEGGQTAEAERLRAVLGAMEPVTELADPLVIPPGSPAAAGIRTALAMFDRGELAFLRSPAWRAGWAFKQLTALADRADVGQLGASLADDAGLSLVVYALGRAGDAGDDLAQKVFEEVVLTARTAELESARGLFAAFWELRRAAARAARKLLEALPPPPVDDDDAARPAEDGGMLVWDAPLADWLETTGAPDAAAEWRDRAGERWATWTGTALQQTTPGAPPFEASDLWKPWIRLPDLLVRLLWTATVRPGLEAREANREAWRSPSMPLALSRHVAAPPRRVVDLVDRGEQGWSLAPALPAAALNLDSLGKQGGRAVRRRLPAVAREAAIASSGPVVLWEEGGQRVTAELLAQQLTLLRIEGVRSIDETLRTWLGLGHGADPWGALVALTRLPLLWTFRGGGKLTGPLVFDARRPRGGQASCVLSASLHPAVAARLEAPVLVPCLPRLPPTWNAKAAELCDRLDHRMMQELALRAPGATPAGAELDVEGLVAEEGGPRYARKRGARLDVLRRLGLDGSSGLWTDDGGGGERRWLVTGDRYLPADRHAAAMLKEGWEKRVNAAERGRRGGKGRGGGKKGG